MFRRQIKALVKHDAKHTLASIRDQIDSRRKKLIPQLTKFFARQQTIMPTLTTQATGPKSTNVKDTILHLPSDLTSTQRLELGLEAIAREEKFLREGEACDALMETRSASQLVSCGWSQKRKHARHQKQNTRSLTYIKGLQDARDEKIDKYNHARSKLLCLVDSNPRFPPLMVQDTLRKPTDIRRQLGDSKLTDGLLWRTHLVHHRASTMKENPNVYDSDDGEDDKDDKDEDED